MRISDGSSDVCSSDLDGTSFRVHDTSGPYTDAEARIDVNHGLTPLRAGWIAARGLGVIDGASSVPSPLEGEGQGGGSNTNRSEERRVGKGGVRTCRSWWSPDH